MNNFDYLNLIFVKTEMYCPLYLLVSLRSQPVQRSLRPHETPRRLT